METRDSRQMETREEIPGCMSTKFERCILRYNLRIQIIVSVHKRNLL